MTQDELNGLETGQLLLIRDRYSAAEQIAIVCRWEGFDDQPEAQLEVFGVDYPLNPESVIGFKKARLVVDEPS